MQLFRAQLLLHPQMRLAFERSLEMAKKTGYVRNSRPVRLALDTSQILGRGAVKETYNLISAAFGRSDRWSSTGSRA